MDKLIHDDRGNTTISNDGATIMKLLEIVHPAARTLCEISLSQDSEVGDGTTTVVLLAGEFLKEAKPFIEDGVHPRSIIAAYRQAARMAVSRIKELSVDISGSTPEERRSMLEASGCGASLRARGCLLACLSLGTTLIRISLPTPLPLSSDHRIPPPALFDPVTRSPRRSAP